MFGNLLVTSLSGKLEFSVLAAGLSALMAWIPIILTPQAPKFKHLKGLLAFFVGGLFLTWLASNVALHTGAKLLSLAGLSFVSYLFIMRGLHIFLVAWCLVYWYLLVPLVLSNYSTSAVITGHLIGTGLVILLNFWKPIRDCFTQNDIGGSQPAEYDDSIQLGLSQVIGFAAIVSLSVTSGLAIGLRWLFSDPTIIANATLNMITPSFKQTWYAAVERLLLGFIGLIGGFYFGWYFPDPLIGIVVMLICSFLALAVVYINFALLVGILFFLSAYTLGGKQTDLAHMVGNEKLIGELIGVVIAVIAIALLLLIQKIKIRKAPQ